MARCVIQHMNTPFHNYELDVSLHNKELCHSVPLAVPDCEERAPLLKI